MPIVPSPIPSELDYIDQQGTILFLDEIGIPLYSSRAAHQTLTLAPAAQANSVIRRTINGSLADFSDPIFHKYASKISCTDFNPAALDGVFVGKILTVVCISELAYLSSGGTPQRDEFSGSSREQNGFTFYRPVLTMMVMNISTDTDEWGAVVQWELDLEEV